MMTVAQIEEAIKQLSVEELTALEEYVGQVIEDRMELAPEFKASIEQGEQDIAAGRVRVRHVTLPAAGEHSATLSP